MTNNGKAERLAEIKEEFLELLAESKKLVRGTEAEQDARFYWLAKIRVALDTDHDYLDDCGVTMQGSINKSSMPPFSSTVRRFLVKCDL